MCFVSEPTIYCYFLSELTKSFRCALPYAIGSKKDPLVDAHALMEEANYCL